MSPVAIGLLVRALVLLAVAWLAVTMLRRQSASLRALVWTAALAGILVLPLMASVAPTLDVPVWRAAAPLAVAPATTVAGSILGGRTFRSSVQAGSKDPASEEMGGPTLLGGRTFRSGVQAGSKDPASEERGQAGSKDPASAKSTEPIAWSQVALLVWGCVALVLAGRIGFSHISLSRLARSSDAAPLPGDVERDLAWAPLVNETRAALGIRRAVQVRTTDAIGVPAVAGLFKPVLLLPAEADDWSDDVKRSVVLHELAHVVRWDAAGQLVSQLACAVYWCVPLAWHGARRAAILREQASDDVVLMSGVRPSSYAANLMDVARLTGNAALEPATLAMAHPRRIRERIVAILDPESARAALRTRSLATVTITAATVVVLVAAIQPTTQAAALPLPSEPVMDAPSALGPTFNIVDVAGGAAAEAPSHQSPAPEVRPESPSYEPLALVPVPQAALGPCERDLEHNSQSIHDNGNDKRWTVTMSGRDCKVDMRVDGTVEFNDTFTDVKSLSRGGTFKLDVTEAGMRRELEIQERGGSLARIYRVEGRERPFDSNGQAWFGQFLITLDRRTAVGVDVRLPMLLRQGGVSAVLRETALMGSDYPRSRYYEKMMASRQLNDSERAQVLKQTAVMTKSDYYASVLLAEVAKGGFQNSELRTAALAILDKMDSDYYRSTAVATVVGQGRPTAEDMDVLVRTVERIKSDHYKLEVLNRLVSGQLQPQHRTALARAARTIDSDFYAAEFLKALAKSGVDDGNRQVFFDVINTIESDFYALEALQAVVAQARLSRPEISSSIKVLSAMQSEHYRNETLKAVLTSTALGEADLLDLVAVIAAASGDYYKSEALQAIVRHRAATDRVRAAVIDASERLSSSYREQVRRAAGR
ncbi:MAG TPA: M56 family metallopeptidase [Vicinamibacterales bacterium]|nr:M56 family metallopeptidase [Vicinamibacterales bacterium]